MSKTQTISSFLVNFASCEGENDFFHEYTLVRKSAPGVTAIMHAKYSTAKSFSFLFLNLHAPFVKHLKVPTCIAGDSFQDAHKTRQRSAPPAVVHLQHARVLISYMRRNHQIFHIPFMDSRNFIHPKLL